MNHELAQFGITQRFKLGFIVDVLKNLLYISAFVTKVIFLALKSILPYYFCIKISSNHNWKNPIFTYSLIYMIRFTNRPKCLCPSIECKLYATNQRKKLNKNSNYCYLLEVSEYVKYSRVKFTNQVENYRFLPKNGQNQPKSRAVMIVFFTLDNS